MLSAPYKKFTQINIVFTFSIYLVSSLLAPYLKERGFFDWQISLMFIVFPLMNIVFLPFLGRLADVLGRRFIIWCGVWLEILALFLYIINGQWAVIVTARILDGLAASLVGLILLAKIGDTVSDGSRGKYTGLSLSLSYSGEIVAPLVGSLLADYFFIRLPFIASAVILFILSFFLWTDEINHLKHFSRQRLAFSWWPQIKLFLSHHQLKGMGIMGVVMHSTNAAMQIFLPLFIVSELGLSYKSIGLAMFAYGLSHLLQGVFGQWGDRWGHWKLVMAGTLGYAVCFGAIYFVSSYWWLVIFISLAGFGASMWNVAAWSLMYTVAEKEKIVAQVFTSYTSLAKTGSLASFLVSAYLVKVLGIPFIFLFTGILIILGNILAYRYLRPKLTG